MPSTIGFRIFDLPCLIWKSVPIPRAKISKQEQCYHLFCILIKSGFSPLNIVQQRWPNCGLRSISRLQPAVWSIAAAFGIYRKLCAASVLTVAFRLTAFFGLTCFFEEDFSQMKVIKISKPSDQYVKQCRHFFLSNYEASCSKLSKIHSVMYQLRNRKVIEKCLLIVVNCFNLK